MYATYIPCNRGLGHTKIVVIGHTKEAIGQPVQKGVKEDHLVKQCQYTTRQDKKHVRKLKLSMPRKTVMKSTVTA